MVKPYSSPDASEPAGADSPLLARAMWMANVNAGVWAVGNGLVSTTLVIALASLLGAEGIGISWILAAPRFAGVLRPLVPVVMGRVASRKVLCIACYMVSCIILAGMAPLAAPGWVVESGQFGLTLLIVCWCLYHLFEFWATVALWSWLGDWMPEEVRGRLTGRRERWLVAGRIAGIGLSLGLDQVWRMLLQDAPRWQPLAASAAAGAAAMLLSVVPLLWLPELRGAASRVPRSPLRMSLFALFDRRYRRLVAYSCYFAFANGLTGAAQGLVPYRYFGFDYIGMVAARAMMRAGQWLLAGPAGNWIDRWGVARPMAAAQLIVAAGPLCYFFATPATPWWVYVAHALWIAYAVLNVGLDTAKVSLALPKNNAPFMAAYYAASDLSIGCSIVLGGWLYDQATSDDSTLGISVGMIFVTGWILRSLASGLALRIPR